MNKTTFADLGLSEQILEKISRKGFKNPTPIQAGVIPLLLNGDKDIIGQADTGTGKTAAFALPLLERLDAKLKKTQAIILAPTRELVMQVTKEIQSFALEKSPTVTVVYGGNPMRKEIAALQKKPNIVVGTPGRMQHHIRNKNLKLDNVKYFVLDEADEMLNFGFREEIEEILGMTPPQRRVLLFSATMPPSILKIVQKHLKNHDNVKVNQQETEANISQKFFCVQNHDKFEALCRVMENEETFYAIIFCRTKLDTDFIASKLAAKHFRAEAIHGDIEQAQREKILKRFKDRKINILVATDVAARGIDISELNFVVNYSLPENSEAYTHRIGRTGRAGNKGVAITFINRSEISRLRFIEKKQNMKIKKETLPSAKEIVAKKEKHLIERLERVLNNEDIKYLRPLAKKLIEEGKAENIIAALLQDAYRGDFDVENHRHIADSFSEPSFSNKRSNSRYPRRSNRSNRGKSNFSNRKKNFSRGRRR